MDVGRPANPGRTKSHTWSQLSNDRFIPARKAFNRQPDFSLCESSGDETGGHLIPHALSSGDQTRASRHQLAKPSALEFYREIFRPNVADPLEGLGLLKRSEKKEGRKNKFVLPAISFKILDAPDLADDFFTSLFELSSKDAIAVSLSDCLYVQSSSASQPTKLYEAFSCEAITSICWDPEGARIGVGNALGQVSVWDAEKCAEVFSFEAFGESKVCALGWGNLMAAGGADGTVLAFDPRESGRACAKFTGHRGEVCAVKWSSDRQFLASAGADCRVQVSCVGEAAPALVGTHRAAVRALAWSPVQHGVLATGGGIADKTIKLWSVRGQDPLASRETGSQVCSLAFSKLSNDLVSGHGGPTNEITFWRTRGLKKIGSIESHAERVLYLQFSSTGNDLVSASSDETIRFWRAYSEDMREKLPRLSPPHKPPGLQAHLMR